MRQYITNIVRALAVLAGVVILSVGTVRAQSAGGNTGRAGSIESGTDIGGQEQAGEYEARSDDRGQNTVEQDHPADNSGKNVRDRDDRTLTSGDQPLSGPDLNITQQIRRAIVADDSLSMDADNVKIITQGGIVTLRGPVRNETEKQAIEAKAQAVNGVTRVDNQLEVKGD